MNQRNIDHLNNELIEFFLSFPLPYADILREQIGMCSISNRIYHDCYIILFERKGDVRQFPQWFPVVPQACQILKESGPLLCQLYIEKGYIVQLEVVDMGMNEIDWDYFWSHEPIFDMEYALAPIRSHLTAEQVCISKFRIQEWCSIVEIDAPSGHHTVCLYDCDIRAFHITNSHHKCQLRLLVSQGERQYLLKSDDDYIEIECSMLYMQDCLHIGGIYN